ncbi:leucine-rich repeat domain-containing protein [Marinoscillum sp. MHG1-6]|uniref:leucine-rich repeat domain-containing protein n=1 Tax=Marinoscillum sp. MHG1-6 TaxID=2959627 RepID=UPI002157D02C|nr:leucine-rich repeat domain-containing protein [Marinoscillum sp. MHG1-6]
MAGRSAVAFALLFLFTFTYKGFSQGASKDVSHDEEYSEVLGLVNFYQYLLNTLGNPKTSARDKEVIVTQSFKKAFRDDRVQIEDDLDNERKVVTNKDVIAYLKDVDFFFNEVRFDFQDINVEKSERDNGQTYFKAAFTNIVKGTDIEGNQVERVSDRFIEINFREEENDLKIVSVYTTKPDRDKELRLWWETLSLAWKQVFMNRVPLEDSVSLSYLNKVTSLDSLDLSGALYIIDLDPLAQVKTLKSVNISHTAIPSLEGVRNLIGLRRINAEGSQVDNLEYLKYLSALEELNIAKTSVDDISVVENLKNLKSLDLTETPVQNFAPLGDCPSLEVLKLNKSKVFNTDFLNQLPNLRHVEMEGTNIVKWPKVSIPDLEILNLSNTMVNTVEPMSSLNGLKELYINSTYITDIRPLLVLKSLRKIYCDDTRITEKQASEWMSKRRGSIVLTNSSALKDWWSALSAPWKMAFSDRVGISSENPNLDALVKLVNLDSLNLSGNQLLDGTPLARLKRLKYLNISGNLFSDISFVSEMNDLEVFIGNDLPVEDITAFKETSNLVRFELKNISLSNLTPLMSHPGLQYVNVDGNPVIESDIIELVDANKQLVVQYKSDILEAWWDELSDDWQKAYLSNIKKSGKPDLKDLHRMIELRNFQLDGGRITSLEPLTWLINVKSLKVSNVLATSIQDLASLESLETLELTRVPVEELEPLIVLKNLKSLNISNTPVTSLRPLSELRNLQNLDCSGTNIKNLKGLSTLYELHTLNLSNTRVWRLDRLSEIPDITEIICYNTRLRAHKIEEFKVLNPNCQITYY